MRPTNRAEKFSFVAGVSELGRGSKKKERKKRDETTADSIESTFVRGERGKGISFAALGTERERKKKETVLRHRNDGGSSDDFFTLSLSLTLSIYLSIYLSI